MKVLLFKAPPWNSNTFILAITGNNYINSKLNPLSRPLIRKRSPSVVRCLFSKCSLYDNCVWTLINCCTGTRGHGDKCVLLLHSTNTIEYVFMFTPTVPGTNGAASLSLYLPPPSLPLSLILSPACVRTCINTNRTCMRALSLSHLSLSLSLSPSLSLSLSLSLSIAHLQTGRRTSRTHARRHARTHFPLAVLLCFVRINEKSSLALGVISVLGVK